MSRRLISLAVAVAVAAGIGITVAPAADAATTPNLTIKTNHASYLAGQTAKVTVHLGVPGGKQDVGVFGQLPGHKAVFLGGLVGNVHGNATFTRTMLNNQTLTVVYTGSSSGTAYKPALAATPLIRVKERIAGSFSGGYRASGGYHYVHHGKRGKLEIAVAPHKGGEKITFPLQAYYGGRWHTKLKHSYTLTNHTVSGGTISTAAVSFVYSTGYRVRIRGEYHGDRLNAAAYTKWVQVKFV